jgi:hypothetical protein
METSLKDAEKFPCFLSCTSCCVLCQPSESLSWSAVSRQMDWDGRSYHKAYQVTRLDPFRFISMRVRQGLGVPNEIARCGWTASLNNCGLWDCYTSNAAKHLARGGISSGHLLGHQGQTCGDLLGNIKSRKLSASLIEVPMFLSILV